MKEILRATEGYPYFIQEWGSQVWDAAPESPITLEAVLEATADVIAHLDANFLNGRSILSCSLTTSPIKAADRQAPQPGH